jgi:hypothetical protein
MRSPTVGLIGLCAGHAWLQMGTSTYMMAEISATPPMIDHVFFLRSILAVSLFHRAAGGALVDCDRSARWPWRIPALFLPFKPLHV